MSKTSLIDGYAILNAVDASTNQNSFAKPTNVKNLQLGSLQVSWTGTPVGALEVHVSNDQTAPAQWTKLDFGAVIAIDSGVEPLKTHLVALNSTPFSWVALKYVATSGTGTLTVKTTTKSGGG